MLCVKQETVETMNSWTMKQLLQSVQHQNPGIMFDASENQAPPLDHPAPSGVYVVDVMKLSLT